MMKKFIKENRLLFSIIAGVIIGCIIGVSCHGAVQSSVDPSPKRLAMYTKFPGELFIRMLKMTIVPLITSSIIVALADIDISSAGLLGKRTMTYYGVTTIFSCVLGLILGMVIKPGSGVEEDDSGSAKLHMNSVDNFLDLFRNAFPDNIVEAAFKSVYTSYTETAVNYRFNAKNISVLNKMTAMKLSKFIQDNIVVPTSWNPSANDHEVVLIEKDLTHDFGGLTKGGSTNAIGLIVFSIAFGIVLNRIGEDGRPLVNVFRSLWKATMKLVEIIMWTAPLGIASIIAGNIVETKQVSAIFRAMGMFMVANVVSNIIQTGIFYPSLYFLFLRRSPLKHLRNFLPAYITAFGTESSAATLPTTMECAEARAKIDERVSRFVLPVGATCNMDGSASRFAITVIFIDQIEPGVGLGTAEIVLTVVVCTVVSIGAAGIPAPGLTNLIIVLESVGLPVGKLGPVFAVEWILARFLTVVNVMGDTYAAAIIEKTSHKHLGEKVLGSEDEKPMGFKSSASSVLLTTQEDETANSSTRL